MFKLKNIGELRADYCGKLQMDSREIFLHDGDKVLCYIKLSNSKELLFIAPVDYFRRKNITEVIVGPGYDIVFDSHPLVKYEKDKMFIIILSPYEYSLYQKKYELYKRATGIDEYNLIKICKAEEELYRQKANKSIRSMSMSDIAGQRLRIGQWVYYIDEGKLKCGVIYSDKQVLTQDLKKKTVKHVIAQAEENMSGMEKVEMRRLTEVIAKWNNQKLQLQNRKNLMLGDVYESDDKYYIYLGKFNLNFDPYKDVNTKITYKHDSSNYYWIQGLKKNINITEALKTKSGILKLLGEPLWDSRKVSIENIKVKDRLYAQYYNVTEFSCFIDKPTYKCNKVGNISKLLKNIVFKEDAVTKRSENIKGSLDGYLISYNWSE